MIQTFACGMTALSPDQRKRHSELAAALRLKVMRFIELPNGYTVQFQNTIGSTLSEFCELELLCCPFFELEIFEDEKSSSVSITGTGNIKPFIRAEFGIPQGKQEDA